MKKISSILLIIFLSIISGCKYGSKLSPSIDVLNITSDGGFIKNVKITWNGYHLLNVEGPIIVCGGGGLSQSFYLQKQSDLFGPVTVEWENAEGKKITKEFLFDKKDLTSDPYYLSTIYLFFTQSDVEYYTSDNPHIRKIQREKRGNWIYKWFEKEGVRKCVNDPKEVQMLRDRDKKHPAISTKTGKPINVD